MSDKDFYELQDMLLNGVHCEWDNRQKCDSLYIEKYEVLETKVKKALELIDKYCSDEYLIAEIKQLFKYIEE